LLIASLKGISQADKILDGKSFGADSGTDIGFIQNNSQIGFVGAGDIG
jgi:hypothetical protein